MHINGINLLIFSYWTVPYSPWHCRQFILCTRTQSNVLLSKLYDTKPRVLAWRTFLEHSKKSEYEECYAILAWI